MKRLISFLTLLACMAVTYAQGTLVATLNHNDTVSIYYGASALIDAHSAAVDGDVITLSSGTFLATDITKGITLRGAGMQLDTLTNTYPTIITGDFRIGVENGSVVNLTIEGIYHNHNIDVYASVLNGKFKSNRFKTISRGFGRFINTSFMHCRVASTISLSDSQATFFNCIISKPENGSGSLEFVNCVIKLSDCHQYNAECEQYLWNSTFYNCIITQRSRHRLPASNMAYNCVCPTPCDADDYKLFHEIPNNSNTYSSCEVLFKTYRTNNGDDSDIDDAATFELTDDAKATFLGTDGTQVGIYGGTLPFDLTTTAPQIKKFDVAPKSTTDGKLKVDIEVSTVAE